MKTPTGALRRSARRLAVLAALTLAALRAAAAAQSAAPAPDTSFDEFFTKFAGEPRFRLDRIRDPLSVRLHDPATGDVRKESWPRAQFRKDMPPPLPQADLKEKGLDQRVKRVSGTRKQVVQYRPEARDYLKTYTFELVKGQWTLVQFEDASR